MVTEVELFFDATVKVLKKNPESTQHWKRNISHRLSISKWAGWWAVNLWLAQESVKHSMRRIRYEGIDKYKNMQMKYNNITKRL